jgi:hypothetical protein
MCKFCLLVVDARTVRVDESSRILENLRVTEEEFFFSPRLFGLMLFCLSYNTLINCVQKIRPSVLLIKTLVVDVFGGVCVRCTKLLRKISRVENLLVSLLAQPAQFHLFRFILFKGY